MCLHHEIVRWRAAYQAGDDDQPETALIEASSPVDAIGRLREVVGTDTDVLYVMPAERRSRSSDTDGTYEDFLSDPGF